MPITIHILLFMTIFFTTTPSNGTTLTGGLFAAIFGLSLALLVTV